MSGATITPYLQAVSEAEDQKQEIMNWVGDVSQCKPQRDLVMVATYARRNYHTTKYGQQIQLSDEELIENRWQGKVGLLLKCGPEAFRFNGAFANITRLPGETPEEYEDRRISYTPKPGDWVLYSPADSREVGFRRAVVRYIASECIMDIPVDPMDYY